MRKVVAALVVVVLLAAVAYLGASAYAWNDITTVNRACLADWEASTPDTFPGVWRHGEPALLDPDPYHFEAEDIRIPGPTAGTDLAAWWSPADKAGAPVVVVVHGRNSCRNDPTSLLPAGMLRRHGIGVLVIDLRDHGDSYKADGHWAAGVDEWQDVAAAWAWLRDQGYDAGRIGLYGGSMGAGSVAYAIANEPAVAAAFLDSPYADIMSTSTAVAERDYGVGVLVPGMLAMGSVLGDANLLGESPEDAFRDRLDGRPVDIVHGTGDDTIPYAQGVRLAEAAQDAGSEVDPWTPEDVEHVQAAFAEPEVYEQRLASFFGAALGTAGER